MKNLLGVDFGTTSLKACLFDENGKMLVSESAQYNLITKGQTVEFDVENFFQIFLSVLKKITDNFSVYAMSIDTQGETLIMLDENDKPVMNAIIWLDSRAEIQAEKIEKKFKVKKIYELTGQAEIPSGYPAPKILWVKENRPEIFKKIKRYFLLEDYIIYRLTGKAEASRSLYSSSLLMDINTGEYIPEMLSFLGINESQLPTLKESGELVGEYNGIKIVTSALDQIAGTVGAGIVKENMMSETTGTCLSVATMVNKIPKWHKGLNVSAYYVRKGLYCLLLWAPTAGATLEWFKKNFCDDFSYDDLNTFAKKVPEGSEGLICIPHLCGTVIPKDNNVKGAFYGITLSHTIGHFIRSIMESIAYTIKEYIDYLNINVEEIRSMGGGAKSKLWCEIKANVTKKNIVTLKQNETACLGSAIFAGVGTGLFETIPSAVNKLVKKAYVYIKSNDKYDTLYKEYLSKTKK